MESDDADKTSSWDIVIDIVIGQLIITSRVLFTIAN